MKTQFTVQNWKVNLAQIPEEDSFLSSCNTLTVADGVTRDPSESLPDIGSLFGKVEFALNYPRPSPAKHVADIFCSTSLDFLSKSHSVNLDSISEAFKQANQAIAKYNLENLPNPDYLTNDFAGCVSALANITQDVVNWGYICDSGLAIFDKSGDLIFKTEDQGPTKQDKYIWQDTGLKDNSWENPLARKIIREKYRNNPSELHSFGVLTGEPSALNYVQTGQEYFKPGDQVIVYTDGLEKVIESGKFADELRKGPKAKLRKICQRNVATEGTLIHYSS